MAKSFFGVPHDPRAEEGLTKAWCHHNVIREVDMLLKRVNTMADNKLAKKEDHKAYKEAGDVLNTLTETVKNVLKHKKSAEKTDKQEEQLEDSSKPIPKP